MESLDGTVTEQGLSRDRAGTDQRQSRDGAGEEPDGAGWKLGWNMDGAGATWAKQKWGIHGAGRRRKRAESINAAMTDQGRRRIYYWMKLRMSRNESGTEQEWNRDGAGAEPDGSVMGRFGCRNGSDSEQRIRVGGETESDGGVTEEGRRMDGGGMSPRGIGNRAETEQKWNRRAGTYWPDSIDK